MIKKVKKLGDLPPPVRAIAAQANKMSDNFAHLTGGQISTSPFPDVYRMEDEEQLIQKAREIDAETQPVLDIEYAKDRKGKRKRGSGHLRRAYIVAVRLVFDPVDEVTGEEHYNTELYYCEVKDIRKLEKLDAERREIDAEKRAVLKKKQESMRIAREAARERRKKLRKSR